MEEEGTVILTISHLIQRACPITAASYSVPRSPISTSKPHKNPGGNYRHEESFRTCENPTLQTLKPLNYPTFLVGTLALPSFANCNSPIKCSCFQFSDDSATICCDILDFDPKMIGQKIRILTWNFIPLTCGNGGEKDGFLEIISWEVFQACSGDVCSFSDSSSFCLSLGVCDVKNKSKTSSLIFGIVESISPVFVVPCVSGESGSRNISGFLVDVLVCQCKFCVSKFLASELRDLTEEKVKDHSFEKRAIVYFSGLTSSWHPVVSRFISNVIWLTGLKQKLVFITNEESKLMYVTTDEASLHVTKFFKEQGLSRNTNIKGRGEIGSYTGVITAIYMQGMVVELDQDVILLLTDQHLIVPHCVRVGAIVTLENVHFVDPKFPWAEMLILGACCRTSMYVESFSPLETRGHLKSHSQTLLQKFINSLPFAARLWALLVVSCFRKKFAGILPEKVILGSKHKEGLAQEYASSHLPPSAFQFRHGVLVEFCRHDSCSVGKEEHYFHLRLVLPIANLISYCEISWKKILVNRENFSDFVGDINQKKPLSCGGRSYVQSIRRVLRTEEIGILVLGTLKTSIYSGRLQLVDATGGVDIMLDLPATWNFDKIFEAKDFTLIMEGVPPDLVDSDSTICQPLSCQSIFSTAQPLRTMKISIYLYHCSTDDSRSHSLFFDGKGDLLELDRGKFHLLMLTHKYPIQQRFQGDRAKRSNMFAQAIVLHWDLLVAGKDKDAVRNMVSAGHWKDLLENFTRQENHLTHKRCKTEQALVEVSNCGLNDSGDVLNCQFSGSCCADRNLYTGQTCISNQLLELPCLVASKGVNSHCLATLCCTIEQAKIVSGCVLPRRKVLLEFSPDSFCMYEVRVFCDLNKQTYPVGLVGDVCATFHRVLVLTQQKKYMMTPVSFITIDDTSLINGHTDEFNYAHETVVKLSNTSQSTVPPVLISDALQLSDLKPMQFRCRVVALYILVVQKAKATAVSRSCGCSILSGVEIPLAGFIMDDGSSSCCCWADSERAAALLGLESEEILLEESAETSGRSKAGKGQQYNSTVSHLDKILEQHGRVVAKNYGSMFDSSFQDLALSVGSGRSISSSEQDLLRSLTTKAFLSASWTIVGSLMHPEASRWLEQQLTELDMAVPSLPNVWAASVNRTDVLAEARNTIQWLM